MMPARLYLLLVACFLLIGCNKEKLKHASEKGANTGSWLVDGDAYKTKGVVDGGPAVYAERSSSIDGPVIIIRLRTGFSNSVTIQVTNYQGAGVYQLNTLKSYASVKSTFSSGSNKYTKLGYVNIIRDDRSKQILAGKFEFMIGSSSGPMIAVTKGRFDIGQ